MGLSCPPLPVHAADPGGPCRTRAVVWPGLAGRLVAGCHRCRRENVRFLLPFRDEAFFSGTRASERQFGVWTGCEREVGSVCACLPFESLVLAFLITEGRLDKAGRTYSCHLWGPAWGQPCSWRFLLRSVPSRLISISHTCRYRSHIPTRVTQACRPAPAAHLAPHGAVGGACTRLGGALEYSRASSGAECCSSRRREPGTCE